MKSNPSVDNHHQQPLYSCSYRYLQDGFDDGEDDELMALKTDDPLDDNLTTTKARLSIERKQLSSLIADNTDMAITDFYKES